MRNSSVRRRPPFPLWSLPDAAASESGRSFRNFVVFGLLSFPGIRNEDGLSTLFFFFFGREVMSLITIIKRPFLLVYDEAPNELVVITGRPPPPSYL